jgi:hypothetical protein
MRQDSSSPINKLVAVTPSDTVNLVDGVSRGLYVGVTGNVAILPPSGVLTTLPGVAAGIWHPVCALRIYATGTTATSIVVGY